MTSEQQYITYDQAKDIFATKADLAQLETRLVKWMVGMVFGGMIASAAIASAVATFLN